MLVVLHTKSKRASSQRIQLRANQTAKLGRSEWADYCFSKDQRMADMHFEVRIMPDGCHVRALSADSPIFLNGEAIKTAVVYDGDEVLAGETTFRVNIEGQQRPSPKEEEPTETTVEVATEVAAALTLAAVCLYLDLPAEVVDLAEDADDLEGLITALTQREQYLDAIRLRGHHLPKRDAVWWGCVCVNEDVDDPLEAQQLDAVESALAWVQEPDEGHRRAAESISNEVQNQGPGGMLALSAFWSESSIGAPDGPDIVPDDRLVCQGVAAALISAAYVGDVSKAESRLMAFLDRGKLVADGKLRPPQVES